MARTEEVTPYYIRTQEGDAFYVDTLKEALEEFLGENGYRLTLNGGGKKEVVIRRTSTWVTELNEQTATAHLVLRER